MPTPHDQHALGEHVGLVFDFTLALPGQASSRHTHRAYFRWVDQFLVDTAGMKPTRGAQRLDRMRRLPVRVLEGVLTPAGVRAWLGMLVKRDHGKQGLSQARASIVTLASLMAEAGWLDDYRSAAISRVRIPRAEDGQRPGHWLSTAQLRQLIAAAQQIATSENQLRRNNAVMTILCTMGLRREELSSAKWGDLSIQNDRPVLMVHGKGRKVAYIDLPRPVIASLDGWRKALYAQNTPPNPESPLIRRLYKGGSISKYGLSPNSVWLIIHQSALTAGLGTVTPHDLRRSVAGALHASSVPIETISRLLRHSSIAVTERYLQKLPQANEGALKMSDLLELDSDALF